MVKRFVNKGDTFFTVTVYILLILFCILTLYPLIYIVSCSLSDPEAVYRGDVFLLPVKFSVKSYERVLNNSEIWTGYKNTIIYGHHLNVSPDMFSRLNLYKDESFCEEHPDFYIYTPDGKVRTYTIFAASVVQDTSDNYTISYDSDADYESYLKLCQDSSLYDTGVEVDAQSQIVSLSTCTNGADTERFLLQGVLTAED